MNKAFNEHKVMKALMEAVLRGADAQREKDAVLLEAEAKSLWERPKDAVLRDGHDIDVVANTLRRMATRIRSQEDER